MVRYLCLLRVLCLAVLAEVVFGELLSQWGVHNLKPLEKLNFFAVK